MQLNNFIAANIPLDLRHGRDFTGPRGWIHLANLLLGRLEQEGVAQFNRIVEVPLYTFQQNGEWFARVPADFRKLCYVYVFGNRQNQLEVEVTHNKFRLLTSYTSMTIEDIGGGNPWTNLGTSDIQATAYRGRDESAQWGNGEAAIYFTNGANKYETRLVTEAQYISGPGPEADNIIKWDEDHPLIAPLAAQNSFLRLRSFLMLRYFARYSRLNAHDDEIPLDDKYENVLVNGLCYLALPPTDKRYAMYRAQFEADIQLLGSDIFTPSEEEARPVGRDWPSFNEQETDEYTSEQG